MPLSAGSRLGPYVIEAALGAGGMGEVYLARDTRLDRKVAVKVLPPRFALDDARVEAVRSGFGGCQSVRGNSRHVSLARHRSVQR